MEAMEESGIKSGIQTSPEERLWGLSVGICLR